MAAADDAQGKTAIESRVAAWQQQADRPYDKDPRNKYAGSWSGAHYQHLGHRQDDVNYGRPVAGSKTEFRGKQACVHISGEIIELCNIIASLGVPQRDGSVAITFGNLFEFYTKISNKLVGMLMRARRQGLIEFEGEMLFQRRDDHVIIRLVKAPEELTEDVEQRKDELRSHAVSKSIKK